MLELKNITKVYETADLKQKALNGVSVAFRKNEFAAILGPSGSGKTTLLNIIGGLDKYTSGDLIINEISTKKFNDRAWDSYRNHRVGFVFQSYNLISHQSILANVELALTLSGVSKKERRKRAKDALIKVGLEKHINKKPNQLSGGQMQRVAIARALVNEPEIILADEPTGALDSTTSVQIMELLKKVASEKLVIMVTHNPDLASTYANRIISFQDGKIISDTNPYDGSEFTKDNEETNNRKSKKTSMKLKTALGLSLNNLMTKKGRTFLTAFAGSIGIIGIALILSLSTGVRNYIDRVQKESLSSYPITIESSSTDLSTLKTAMENAIHNKVECKNLICTTDDITNSPLMMMQTITYENNLKEFKKFLDSNKDIKKNITDIGYSYNMDLQIYSENGVKVNPNTFSLMGSMPTMMDSPLGNTSSFAAMNKLSYVFQELINSDDLLNSQYEVLSGSFPKKYDEAVLIVDENNNIPLSVMYSLDVENREEILGSLKDKDNLKVNLYKYNYNDFVGKSYKLVLNTDYYTYENGLWKNNENNKAFVKNLVKKGLDIKIVGVLKIRDDATTATSGFVGYTNELTKYVINKINDTQIAKEQRKNTVTNIVTGEKFDLVNTHEDALTALGVVDLDDPYRINIYPKDYEAKENIENLIIEYNEDKTDENKISYTDMVGLLMSGLTTIVDVISYVLIAFVAISLVVSSIMIAIITYISVLERTKEIGILRAIGASKKDISRVFNAETIIEGFIAGILGIVVTLLVCIPINIWINNEFDIVQIAKLPTVGAIVLVIISVILTVIAGLIPSKMASKKDPVEALRSE